eukprot:s3158_g6.t1
MLEELVLGLEDHERPEMAQEALQLQKRRRVSLKQPEQSLYGRAPTWRDVFRQVGYSTPRVGNSYYMGTEGDAVFKMVQQMVPEMTVKLVVACRGTDRHRIQPSAAKCEMCPWRKTVIVTRDTGEIRDLGPPENWSSLSRARQIRSTGPAKLSVTIFGVKDEIGVVSQSDLVPSSEGASGSKPDVSAVRSDISAAAPPLPDQEMLAPDGSSNSDQGWVPRIIPKSGPAFLQLSSGEQSELRRLHNNLGHPSPDKLLRFLNEQGAKPEILAGARDMCCDTCVETQNRPKLPQPSRIHEALDFNDLVGADGAYWTNASGKTFHFTHFIDEATLYHVGAVSARKVEDQIRVFLQAWVQWAGPCQTLYLDPAGEYISEEWAAVLQSEGIRVAMTAAEAHWQNGRAEAHGRIVKNMLTRMEKDHQIETVEEFSRCLRQAFAAKNSLSRVNGFTPEQCLLGKSRRLPGFVVSDSDLSGHSLAESQLPEGVKFRESLQRRESARKAFVQADNDSSFRRALLRQSRPGKVEYEKGDWVLYWRRSKGNSRIDRGRWYGPAQVIVSEKPRVIWLSHLGRVIRASPEQIRPASLREYVNLPRDELGQVKDEQPSGRGYVDLGNEGSVEHPEDLPEMEVDQSPAPEHPGSELSYAPTTPLETQPEDEQFPSGSSIPSEESPELAPETGDDGVDLNDGRYVPVPMDDGDDGLLVFGDDVDCNGDTHGVWEIHILDHDLETTAADLLCQHPEIFEEVFVATGERKKRIELDYRRLDSADQKLFDAAKQKEVKAWLDHGTVKRLSKGTLSPEQVMRCRWLLTWKDPAPGSTERRAKARLIILGFEDPGVGVVPNDAPTLSKDAKQLLLQKAASRRWQLINFDISTAFLKGEGDGRPLGIHPPVEIRQALGMGKDDQCGLEGGAYGRVDAPFLWYRAFKATLESLGFVTCPFDGCLFSLVTSDPQGKPFKSIIQKLRGIYDFGAYNEGEFDFCGVHYKQWDDGSIEMDQGSYIQKIEPIEIPRSRRSTPEAAVTELERQQLRRLCGSLQYAAVHARPDLAAKTGQLQAVVTRAQVKHLIEANRVLYEGKTHPVCLMLVPIPESQVAFCAFSDASFSTSKDLSSRQGTLIFATDTRLAQNEKTVVCPIAWSSRKIPRVVTSTLSAESMALSSALDRLGYIRIVWEWLKNPAVDWADPSQVLAQAPTASAVTDCKSVYDIATKTSTPVCSEYRTTLECLLIRERLQENVAMRWISTQAMLADSLTKSMDSSMLRECLRTGRYTLFDEGESLRQRASKRERLQWLKEGKGS